MSLFGGAGGAGAAGGGPEFMHSFKAGRCDFNIDSKTVTPAASKGLIFIQKAPDIPGMMQVGWRNRETGEVVDKHLTCNDATFIPCKSAGDARVFCLKFENNRRCFFWMQELDGSSDEQNALRLNDIIAGKENEPTAGAAVDLENLGIGEEEMMAINALPPNERDELLMQLGLAAPSGMMGDFGGPVMTPAAQPAPIHPPPVLRANQDPGPPSDSPMLEVPTPDLGGDDDDEDDAEEGDDAMDAE